MPGDTKVLIYIASMVLVGIILWFALSLLKINDPLPLAVLCVLVVGVVLPALQRLFSSART